MNNKLHILGGLLIIFFILISQPLSIVQASDTVDDWLEDDNNQTDEEETETNEKNDEKGTSILNENDTQSDQNNRSESLFIVIVKMVFALFLVLGLIYGLLQFLKRKKKLFIKSNTLENVGGITVGSNKSMQIVRIGSRFFVIGVGENVEMLHEITDPDVVHELMDNEKNNQKSANRMLSSFTGKKETSHNEGHNFKALFSRELFNLKQSRKKIMNENKEDTHE